MKYYNKFSELLGILNSINYDNIINEKEIQMLKKWITENNNDNNIYCIKIIKLLNQILKDNLITNQEKEKIIKFTNYYNNIKNKIDNESELIGIIQGIEADDIINFQEIIKLKKWLKNNQSNLENSFFSKVNGIIDKYLKDNYLSKEEQKEIILSFKEILYENGNLKKLRLIKYKLKNNEIIGNDIIDIINDAKLVNKIHYKAQEELQSLLQTKCSIYDIDYDIIFISLTIIGLINYDGNFYNHVRKIYKYIYNNFSEQKIEGQIRNIISIYNTQKEITERIISVVLKNDIVPQKYLPSFFDFLYDVYKLNFDYSISEKTNLSEELLFVYEGIKGNNFENDQIDLKVTNKTYKLIKTTKDLITDEKGINDLIKLSGNVLKIIDEYYWKNQIPSINNKYYNYGFEIWQRKVNKEIKEKSKRKIELSSRWEPKFLLNSSNIYLSIPNHKIKNSYDYTKLKLVISNGDEIISKEDLDVYDIIGGYRIECSNILIENPLGKLEYKLLCGNQTIYDSKNLLYRDYIVFNSEGREIKNNNDYEGLAIFCVNGVNIENSWRNKLLNKNYQILYLNVKKGDTVKIGNDIFSFSSLQKTGLIGVEANAFYFNNKEKLKIYKYIKYLIYETKLSCDDIIINIDGVRNKLTHLNYTEKHKNASTQFVININNLTKGIHTITIEEHKNNQMYKTNVFKVVVDKDFNYLVDEYSDNELYIKINTSFTKNIFEKIINLNSNDINKIYFDKYEFGFIIPINIPIYRIDNNMWKRCNEYIWTKDIKFSSKIVTNGIAYDKVYIVKKDGTVLTTLYSKDNLFCKELDVGTLISYNKEDIFYLKFLDGDNVKGLIQCYNKCFVNAKKTNLKYDPIAKNLKANVSIYGRGNISYEILDEKKQIIFNKKIESSETQFIVNGLTSFKTYLILIKEDKTGLLGKERILYKENFSYISLDDFVGRYFKIYTVDFDQMIGNNFTRKTYKLYDTYIEITKRISDTYFIGNIYTFKKGQKHMFNNLNPIEIDFTSDINDGLIEASITKDGDGLFIDFDNRTVLDKIESNRATDIFSCLLIVERR